MANLIGFKVWYADQGTKSSNLVADGGDRASGESLSDFWDSIPQTGIQGGYKYFDDGKRQWWMGREVYVLTEAQQAAIKDASPSVKLGEGIPDDDFNDIVELVKADTETFE